jgi:Secretion system C-terminal sorting domain
VADTLTVQLPIQNTELNGTASYDPDGTISRYKWNYKKGPSACSILSPDASKTVISNLIAGTYNFELAVTDNDSATASKIVTVIVKNSSGRILILSGKMYPNPATTTVNVVINADVLGRTTIILYNMNGRPVLKDVFDKGTYSATRQINVSRLRKGVYTVSVQVDRSAPLIMKLVVQ